MAVGGPANGVIVDAPTRWVHVPVPVDNIRSVHSPSGRTPPTRFRVAIYEWEKFSGMWFYRGELD